MNPVRPVNGHADSRFVEFAKDQPEYLPLPAFVDGAGLVQTEWELSEIERIAIGNGARVRLWVYTFGRPLQPVKLEVGSPRDAQLRGDAAPQDGEKAKS